MAEHKKALTTTGNVHTQPGYLYGYTVTAVLGAGIVTLYDNTSAAGTVLDVIAASTAAGTSKMFAEPIPLDIGLHAVFASTGTILFLFD